MSIRIQREKLRLIQESNKRLLNEEGEKEYLEEIVKALEDLLERATKEDMCEKSIYNDYEKWMDELGGILSSYYKWQIR
tara:strand:- start:118 stop:354 length:237 start_codon:yes stop_codon:yes gene_type:complete